MPRGEHGIPARLPWAGVALISAAALGYEILLTRLLAIVHWHHFAAMVISLALLGYGASGTFLVLLRRPLMSHVPAAFLGNGLLFSLGAPACFLLAQALPLDPLELAWDWHQAGRLGLIYLLLSLPFFAAANCIGITLLAARSAAHRVYAFDLIGAASGAVLALALLHLLPVARWLPAVTALGLVAVAAATLELQVARRRRLAAAALAAGVMSLLLPPPWVRVEPAAYKELSQALAVLGARIEQRSSGPLGELTLVDNPQVPMRSAPGLSLLARERPPPQLALYLDGNGSGVVPRDTGADGATAYLDGLGSALPYHLQSSPRVLLPGLGGGSGLLQALSLGAGQVTVVELDANRAALLRPYLSDTLERPEVELRVMELRGFLARSDRRFGLIQLDLLGGGGSGGLHAQSAGFLLTAEALSAYLEHLAPGGMLAVTQWLRLPPRPALKLAATLGELLRRQGVADPGARMALIRSWKTTTLILKDGPFDAVEIAALRKFCRDRAFDTAWFPGIEAAQVNRFNRLDQPLYYQGMRALLGSDPEAYISAYRFDLRPASDDRPYFDDFSRWDALPELLRLPARGGLAQLDWGYWLQLATLVQALVIGAVLILLPLLMWRRAGLEGSGDNMAGRMLGYFALIGLAFMFVEIAFIQKLQLLLGHPVYAVALVLAGFLLFAGIGSALSRRLAQGLERRLERRQAALAPIWLLVLCLALLCVLELLLLSRATPWLMAQPLPLRAACALVLIAPLALCMGMPFPWGLRRLEGESAALVAWAWGMNGFASVVSAVAAGLLAMEIGFSGLLICGVFFYLGAAALLSGRRATT